MELGFLPRDDMRKARPLLPAGLRLSVTFMYCTTKDIVKLSPRPGSPIIFFIPSAVAKETPSCSEGVKYTGGGENL